MATTVFGHTVFTTATTIFGNKGSLLQQTYLEAGKNAENARNLFGNRGASLQQTSLEIKVHCYNKHIRKQERTMKRYSPIQTKQHGTMKEFMSSSGSLITTQKSGIYDEEKEEGRSWKQCVHYSNNGVSKQDITATTVFCCNNGVWKQGVHCCNKGFWKQGITATTVFEATGQ